jgi:hypothetical protein
MLFFRGAQAVSLELPAACRLAPMLPQKLAPREMYAQLLGVPETSRMHIVRAVARMDASAKRVQRVW